MKILLLVLTIIQLGLLGVMFFTEDLWTSLYYDFKAAHFLLFFHTLVTAIFLWYNWKRLPIDKRKKIDNSLMILF